MSDEKKSQETLTRLDLIDVVGAEIGNASTARDIVNSFFDEAEHSLVKEGYVKMHNFGRFETSKKRERVGRNPKNGVQMKITARTVVKFRPSNKLREAVRNASDEDAD